MKRSIPFRPTLLALVLATNFPVAHAAVPKDMLVIGKAADPQTLDPAVTIDNNDWTVTYPSYQRLVQYKTDGDKGSTDVEGDLASSWKASDDQKEWTFTLKDNAKFADGTPVTAEAVKLSFERLLKIGQGPAEAFPKDLKIDAPDEHTVKFTLSQPFAPFLYTLANDGASIINPAVLKEHAADDARGFLAQNTAGSGPFMLKSWQKGQQLVLVPNPHYPGNKPNFKRVSVKIIGESASRRLQLSRGDIDIADALPVDQLNALKQENKVNVAEYPSLRVTYLYLNNSKAPLNQADLRRAISWSTDYQGMVNGILSGNGKQMRGPIPEGMWGYDATAMQYNHDETKAKAELQVNRGLTYVLISHNVSVIRHMSDRVAVMYLGQIVELGDAQQVLTAPAHPYTRLLLDSLPAIDKPLEEEWALRKTDLPGNRTLPQGCFFYERCPLATHGCEVRQSLTIREDGREIRCWRAL